MHEEIGRRLREIRTRLGMSQRQLGRISGVANATISQIESNKLNPTVSMLKKVLDGIPISMSEFFSENAEFAERIFYRVDDLTKIADGGVSYLQVGANLHNRSIQFLKECYQPGAGTGKHAMTHEGEECGIILNGRLDVTVADQTTVLRAGDAYYFRSDQPHQFRNSGNEPCELITACTPPSF
jgi:transcriptional regulator with XRE-family HTH domain